MEWDERPISPRTGEDGTGAAGWTGVFAPASLSADRLRRNLSKTFGRGVANEPIVRFSVMGSSLDLGDPTSDRLHVLAGLDPRFRRAVILGQSPVLFATESVFCWLDNLLGDMGPGGELWVQFPDPKGNRENGHITPHALERHFTRYQVAKAGQWSIVGHPDGGMPGPPPARTIYRFLHRRSDRFLSWYMADSLGDWTREKENSATITFIYSVYGMFYRDFLVERISRSQNPASEKRILDVGGGLGFFAAERAAHGDRVTVIDKNPRYLATARRLFEHCGVADRISTLQMRMEALGGIPEKYDLITFFNSLYYADRATAAAVLDHAFALLNPGGFVVLLENPKGAGDMKPENYEYDAAFSLSDFLRLMEPFGERVAYWHLTTGKPTATPRRATQLAVSIAKPR